MNRRQTIPAELRYTFQQFDRDFPTDDACLEQIKEQRFPGGVADCHKCEKPRKHYRVRGRTAYACESCGNHIYPLAGTIFEKSSTALRIWFHAMYLMGSTRCGISAKQIQRETGVTYKTAWRMFRQIRKLMAEGHSAWRFENGRRKPRMTRCTTVVRRKNESGRNVLRGDLEKKTMVTGIVERKACIAAWRKLVIDHGGEPAPRSKKGLMLPQTTIFTDEERRKS